MSRNLKLTSILKSIKKEVIDAPQAFHQQLSSGVSSEFLNYIKSVENSQKVGFKDGLWFPHKSPEGGFPTIGYGHKIKDESELRISVKGVSDSVVNKLLKQDLEEAKSKVYRDIKDMFGVNIPLDSKREEILIDFAFNLGSIKGFPKLTKAVLNNDWNTVKQEYKRSFKSSSGERKELGTRNVAFASRFLKENNLHLDSGNDVSLTYDGKTTDANENVLDGYILKNEHCIIRFGYDSTNRKFATSSIITDKDFRNQGYAKKLLNVLFTLIKKYKGILETGAFTHNGQDYLIKIINDLAKTNGIRVVDANKWNRTR